MNRKRLWVNDYGRLDAKDQTDFIAWAQETFGFKAKITFARYVSGETPISVKMAKAFETKLAELLEYYKEVPEAGAVAVAPQPTSQARVAA